VGPEVATDMVTKRTVLNTNIYSYVRDEMVKKALKYGRNKDAA
jgi:hypothetical protein